MWSHVRTLEVATRQEICVEMPMAHFSSSTSRHLCISPVSTPCEFGLNATQCKSPKPFCVISDEMSLYVKTLEVATLVKSVAKGAAFLNSSITICVETPMATFTYLTRMLQFDSNLV